jgi:hypothetical protein
MQISGLHLDSLALLLDKLDTVPPESKNAHIHKVLGPHTGPSIVKFLKAYLARRQPELDAWRASQASGVSETSEASEE